MAILLLIAGGVLAGCDSGGGASESDRAMPMPTFRAANPLTADDVRTIIAQTVTQAVVLDVAVTVVVTDRGGNVLGAFRMPGAAERATIDGIEGTPGQRLEGVDAPSELAALSKAGTAAFFSTSGNAFTTRTAGDIIQEHRPVSVMFTPSGLLFGVQFSSLPCTDIKTNPPLPLGIAADPGGVPLYKNGAPVGGLGVEGDGVYGIDRDPFDDEQPFEELLAVAGTRGFEAPAAIRGDTILLDGVRLPFVNAEMPAPVPVIDFDMLPGALMAVGVPAAPTGFFDGTIRDTPDPAFGFAEATLAGLPGRIAVDAMGNTRFPLRASPDPGGLTANDVETILTQAIQQAFKTRAAIRQPRGSFAQVNVAVVDASGTMLGYFSTADAPFFGFDVSVQKARTSAFFSSARAGQDLTSAGFTDFVNAALADGLRLDGSVAFSDRGAGFLNRPFLPDGIDGTAPGPFSRPISEWSPFNVGLQLSLVQEAVETILLTPNVPTSCTRIAGLENGIQIFAGSVPLYKNGVLVGAIGVSGDGIDQDDLVAASGSAGFEAPPAIRSDQVLVRGARLPFVRFPRNPELR